VEETKYPRLAKMETATFFDHWYNGTYPVNREDRTTEFVRVKELFDEVPIKPALVLDHGCGQGSWVLLLSSKFENANIIGIEISRNGVEIASKQFPKQEFLLFDGETAPFADGSFDLIFSYHVLTRSYFSQDEQKVYLNNLVVMEIKFLLHYLYQIIEQYLVVLHII